MIEFNGELNRVVREYVQKGAYPEPEPTIEDQIKDKRNEIKELKRGVGRPDTKSAYLSLLGEKQAEVDALVAENEAIKERNTAARKAVDDHYTSDIAKGLANQDYQWEALKTCADWQLNDTIWWMLHDSSLTETQVAEANAWRASIMSLRADHEAPDAALVEYNVLVESKPKWELW